MTDLTVTEVLPEGVDRIWVSLSDGLTRLLSVRPLLGLTTHRGLHLPDLTRRPRVTPDGRCIRWPGGPFLDADSVLNAPSGSLPVDLLALVPFSSRFRPLQGLLLHARPNLHGYGDVRPMATVQTLLGMTAGELEPVFAHHRPASEDLVLGRLSDLALLLWAWFPDGAARQLLRRPWPYALRQSPGDPLVETALGCLRFGRIDLVEAPLVLLATGGP